MKRLTLLLSILISLSWFSCQKEPGQAVPYANDTSGIDIPSVPLDTPAAVPPNPADTFVGVYYGTTRKIYILSQPRGPLIDSFDTTYADKVVIYKDATDKYNTFHIIYPVLSHSDYTYYDTLKLKYDLTNIYNYSFNMNEYIQLKVFTGTDSIYLNYGAGANWYGESVIFSGKK